MKQTAIKKNLNILIFIFSINFLWEISQMFLYENHTNGFWDFIWVHIKASLGDAVIFFTIYLLGILILQNNKWISAKNNYKYFLASFLGFLIAVMIEKYALATNRWQYTEMMPIIPYLKVGLSPILQMITLPSFTIFFFENLKTKNSRR